MECSDTWFIAGYSVQVAVNVLGVDMVYKERKEEKRRMKVLCPYKISVKKISNPVLLDQVYRVNCTE